MHAHRVTYKYLSAPVPVCKRIFPSNMHYMVHCRCTRGKNIKNCRSIAWALAHTNIKIWWGEERESGMENFFNHIIWKDAFNAVRISRFYLVTYLLLPFFGCVYSPWCAPVSFLFLSLSLSAFARCTFTQIHMLFWVRFGTSIEYGGIAYTIRFGFTWTQVITSAKLLNVHWRWHVAFGGWSICAWHSHQ